MISNTRMNFDKKIKLAAILKSSEFGELLKRRVPYSELVEYVGKQGVILSMMQLRYYLAEMGLYERRNSMGATATIREVNVHPLQAAKEYILKFRGTLQQHGSQIPQQHLRRLTLAAQELQEIHASFEAEGFLE